MKPIERGQIVKFHTPYDDEDPEQSYVVLEVFEDKELTRAKIIALNTGLSFAPISVAYVRDLNIDSSSTKGLNDYLSDIGRLCDLDELDNF